LRRKPADKTKIDGKTCLMLVIKGLLDDGLSQAGCLAIKVKYAYINLIG
jgi:hypothetical protein